VFPGCLPDPSNELLRSLSTLRDKQKISEQEALVADLTVLHDAIIRGLGRKKRNNFPRVRIVKKNGMRTVRAIHGNPSRMAWQFIASANAIGTARLFQQIG
jgi:hypothetical protein